MYANGLIIKGRTRVNHTASFDFRDCGWIFGTSYEVHASIPVEDGIQAGSQWQKP